MELEKRKLKPEDVDVTYNGSMITLPDDPEKMTLRSAVDVLEQKIADEETLMDVHEHIYGHPQDALVALNKAIQRRFGWTSATGRKVQSFFGTHEVRPDLLNVQTGPYDSDKVQVISGTFKLPNVENPINCTPNTNNGKVCLTIYGECRKRDRAVIMEVANLAREILRNESIYKGKSIKLHTNRKGQLDPNAEPEFLHTDNVDVGELILNSEELMQVEAALWAPITQTALCKQHGVPLNRGILLEGTYGCGKSMTAHVTSRVCVDNGWTYIYLDDVRALADALVFAQRYQPAVVFAEDIDRVANERDQRGNDLLNTIDGVLTKNSEVITVLTTNHVEKLEVAMLRPGRLDAVISVKAPGAEAVTKLLGQYTRGLMADGENFEKVAQMLAGHIPATIREVAERSKLAMIYRGADQLIEDDLIVSTHNMQAHLDLLADKPEPISDEEALGIAVGKVIGKAVDAEQATKVAEQTDALYERIIN